MRGDGEKTDTEVSEVASERNSTPGLEGEGEGGRICQRAGLKGHITSQHHQGKNRADSVRIRKPHPAPATKTT